MQQLNPLPSLLISLSGFGKGGNGSLRRWSGPSRRPTETDARFPAVPIHSPGSRQGRDGAITLAPSPHGTEALWPCGTSISASHSIILALGLVTSGPNCHADKQTVKRDRENKMRGFALCPSFSLSSQLFAYSLAGNMCVCSAEG